MAQLRLTVALWAKYTHEEEIEWRRFAVAAASCAVKTRRRGGVRRGRAVTAGHPGRRDSDVLRRRRSYGLRWSRARTLGLDDEGTLVTAGNLGNVLNSLGEWAEVEALDRVTLEKERRMLGRDHHQALTTPDNLASTLSEQGNHAKAVELRREVLVSTIRLLGAEHEGTLTLVLSLAIFLLRCGLKTRTESKQLPHDTLALTRRALGPNHRARLRTTYSRAFARSVQHPDERPGRAARTHLPKLNKF